MKCISTLYLFLDVKTLSADIVDKWMKKVREKSSNENAESGKIPHNESNFYVLHEQIISGTKRL